MQARRQFCLEFSLPRTFLTFTLMASLAALAGCNVGPNYHAPDLHLEAAYASGSPTTDAAAWWVALNDPLLNTLIATANENNLDLRLAQARIREARAQRAIAYGGELPVANVGGQYDYQRYSQNAAPFNAFNIPGFPWEFNLYQAGFDASWEMDVFGGTRRAIEAANDSLQASEEDRHAVLVTLLGEVARNYVELRGYQDQRAIAVRNLEVQNETLTLTRDRMTNGVGNDLDVSRAAAQVSQTAAAIPVYERQEWQAIHRLAVLTNQPLEKLLFLRDAAPIPEAPQSVMVGVPADLLRRRPDIRHAERDLAAASARVGMAEAELYPKFSLTGFFDLQSASIEDLVAWRSRAFSIGPAIAWPIFEAGRLRAAVEVRNAQQEQAMVTYEQTVQRAIQEVRDGLISFTTERQRRDSLGQAVKADQDALDLARQLYGQGLTDFLTVLDAQRQLYQAQDALSQSDEQVTASLIALYKALGGGWESALPEATTLPATRPATAPASMSAPAPASPQANAPTKENVP